jgi:hypothetical protein
MYLIDFCCFFILLMMNECAGDRGSMPCLEEGKFYFHSIRNLSAYHVKGSIIFLLLYANHE